MEHIRLLTDEQLKSELERSEYCEEKPCRDACPAHCSPADFIMAARIGEPGDYQRAAAEIMMANPFGGVCGLVCPDRFCMAACSHKDLDGPIDIPAVQATLVQKAKDLGRMPQVPPVEPSGHRVAVVGAGPAGLATASMLARKGHSVVVFDQQERPGGMCNLIPQHRLPRQVLDSDIQWQLNLGDITFQGGQRVDDPATLLEDGFEAVVVATGLDRPIGLGIRGEKRAVAGLAYLADPDAFPIKGHVVVVGGGATAVDCAVTARRRGATRVEMICLERWDEMPLTPLERQEIAEHHIDVNGRTRLTRIKKDAVGSIDWIKVQKVALAPNAPFSLAAIKPIRGSKAKRRDIDHVIIAIGARPGLQRADHERVFYAGDLATGPATVVECSASGKNVALQVDALLNSQPLPVIERPRKSETPVPGYSHTPVSLQTDFFGRSIRSPFLLSAAPPSDGLEQMRLAYEAGWAGGVMKTAFDNVPIHIPGEYMHVFDKYTWGNSDNVSGHSLDRVCQEIRQLVEEYPDRLTMASTGGPVTGDDDADKAIWQSNTRKLEAAGVMGIEYSLSCPQGGDGTEGDIVSQSPGLTAKIIDWVLQTGEPDVPKLFKLTAAVTSIEAIMAAIAEVLQRHPGKKAGVTLANTFPTVNFREGRKAHWEEAIVVGMSGRGVAPISNFTLSRVGAMGVYISGNGGPMDYLAAAHFLALGASSVQFCTIAMKQGYGIIRELESGLSHLLSERGISSVAELIGRTQPEPITDFMALSPVKKISQVDESLCLHCGNCTRCPYLAISLDENKLPVTDPSLCIGCSICVQKCFAGALYMRERTQEEADLLQED